MPLTSKQLQDICLLYSGDHRQCRYLAEDDDDPNKWYCLKEKKDSKDKIDKRLSQFITDCKRKGIDPHSQGIPLGNNCAGYPILKFVDQGYDV